MYTVLFDAKRMEVALFWYIDLNPRMHASMNLKQLQGNRRFREIVIPEHEGRRCVVSYNHELVKQRVYFRFKECTHVLYHLFSPVFVVISEITQMFIQFNW